MKLKELRIKHNYTSEQIAKLLQISVQAYYKYENGKAEPSIESLKKLSHLYHNTIDEIVENKINNLLNTNLLSETEQSIINTIQQLNKDFLLKVEAYAYACLERQNEESKIIKKIKGE